jgi:hypothetical protein
MPEGLKDNKRRLSKSKKKVNLNFQRKQARNRMVMVASRKGIRNIEIEFYLKIHDWQTNVRSALHPAPPAQTDSSPTNQPLALIQSHQTSHQQKSVPKEQRFHTKDYYIFPANKAIIFLQLRSLRHTTKIR